VKNLQEEWNKVEETILWEERQKAGEPVRHGRVSEGPRDADASFREDPGGRAVDLVTTQSVKKFQEEEEQSGWLLQWEQNQKQQHHHHQQQGPKSATPETEKVDFHERKAQIQSVHPATVVLALRRPEPL
jgi:hypothetical protein